MPMTHPEPDEVSVRVMHCRWCVQHHTGVQAHRCRASVHRHIQSTMSGSQPDRASDLEDAAKVRARARPARGQALGLRNSQGQGLG
jgi:hypothetical protein